MIGIFSDIEEDKLGYISKRAMSVYLRQLLAYWLTRAFPHSLEKHTFTKVVHCDHCKRQLGTLTNRHGYQCTDCLYICHAQCRLFARATCMPGQNDDRCMTNSSTTSSVGTSSVASAYPALGGTLPSSEMMSRARAYSGSSKDRRHNSATRLQV